MSVFRVNFDNLVLQLLPTFLRKLKLYSFLTAAMAPLKTIYYEFIRQRDETLLLLKYDTGKRNIELALRTKFGAGIYIGNVAQNEGLHLEFYLQSYLEEAGYQAGIQTAYLEQYLSFYLDETQKTDDFIIYVPELIYLVHAQEIYDFAGLLIIPGFKYKVERY